MNENEKMEQLINDQIKLIGRYRQPSVDSALSGRIVASMVCERDRVRMGRWIIRLALPLAAAACLALAVWVFTSADKKITSAGSLARSPSGTPAPQQTEIVAIWSQGLEVGAKAVFADLDFETNATTQPAYLMFEETPADEMDKYVIEELTKTAS